VLYKEIPFLRFTVAIVCGILVAEMLQADVQLFIPTILLSVIVIILWYHRNKMTSTLFGLTAFLFIFLFGFIDGNIRRQSLLTVGPGSKELTVRISDWPSERARTLKIPAMILELDGSEVRSRPNNVMLYLYKDSYNNDLEPGDAIKIYCELAGITDFNPSDNFDYASYMIRKGYRYLAFINTYEPIMGKRKGIKANALILRKKLATLYYENGISGDNLALVSALTLGYREMLTDNIEDSFSRSGIMHVLAVSGLHVGILSFFILAVLSFLKGKLEILKLIIVLFAIWLFALVTGLSPPVVRAAIMFSILHAGRAVNRPVNSLNSVLASAFLMLVINPGLLFDPGFQLSYSAVIFIIVFYREMNSIVQLKSVILKRVWELTVVSLVAQLGTLPFVIYYFHRIPLLSLVANLMAIPMAFIILATGFLMILSTLVPFITPFFASILNFSLEFMLRSATDISTIPFSSVSTPSISIIAFILFIVTVPVISGFLLKDQKVHPHLALCLVILCLLGL